MGLGLLAALVVVGVVVASAYYFSDKAKMQRRLATVARVDIGRVADGALVKCLGHVTCEGEPLIAPLSARPCAYYEVRVTQRRGKRRVTIVRESGGRNFILRDGTGKALVKLGGTAPAMRQVVLHKDTRYSTGTFQDAPARFEALLARHGQSSRGFFFNKDLAFSEGVIEADEEVVVAGQGRWETDPDPDSGAAGAGYRDGPRRLVLGPTAEFGLCVSDDVDLLAAAKKTKNMA